MHGGRALCMVVELQQQCSQVLWPHRTTAVPKKQPPTIADSLPETTQQHQHQAAEPALNLAAPN